MVEFIDVVLHFVGEQQPAPTRGQSGGFGSAAVRAPKLEIKKDAKGMVSVPGATMIEVTSAKELLATIEKGQQRRHVSSTQVLPPTGPS